MKLLKGSVIAMGVLAAIAIPVYLYLVRIPLDAALDEATRLCASVPTGSSLSWGLIDNAHLMKVDPEKADRSKPPGDGLYLMMTSGGPLAKYGCEIEISGGTVKDARAVKLPGWD